MREFFRRITYLAHRARRERELAAEMEFHREMASGHGGGHFGNALRLREQSREAWGWMWTEQFAQDVRYAVRSLRKSPGFTLAAMLMLAIGAGVNIAAFGFANLMLLRPLPVRDPASLLRFDARSPNGYSSQFPYPEAVFFGEHCRSLSAVMALHSDRLSTTGEEQPVLAHFVTSNYFGELGGAAQLGRMLDSSNSRDGAQAQPAVVLSDGFWRRHYAANPSILGKTITLNGLPAVIIGVASPAFSGLTMESPQLWAVITWQPLFLRGSNLLTDFSSGADGINLWGRLRPGVSPQAAEQDLEALAAELHRQHPREIWAKGKAVSQPGGYATGGMTLSQHGSGSGGPRSELYPAIGLLSVLSFLILAATCANLGSLLMARGLSRAREVSIRVSIGAGTGRLVRQLFTESLVLAFLGSLAGLILGQAVLRLLASLTELPSWLDPRPDWRVATFCLGVSFASAVLFGLAPAFHIARRRNRVGLKRHILIGAQVAASCVLLIVAGLLVRALHRAISRSPGFDIEQVIVIDPGLAAHSYSPANARSYLDRLKGRLLELRGVQSVALASTPPLGHKTVVLGITSGARPIDIHVNQIDPEFFGTMQIPLLRGRNFRASDSHGFIMSDSLARRWPTGDPLGREFSTGNEAYTVVGIAGNARATALQNPDAVEGYFLAQDADLPSMTLLVKTKGAPEGLTAFLAELARRVDPTVFPEIETLKTSFHRKLEGAQYSAVAVTLLSAVALLMACLGIAGLVAYAVSERTKEIGIRMALGATRSHVLTVVLRQFSRPVLTGLASGMGGAAALSRLLRHDLYGISGLDPLAYLGAVVLFALTGVAAALIPARRALRVEPLEALREE